MAVADLSQSTVVSELEDNNKLLPFIDGVRRGHQFLASLDQVSYHNLP